MEWTKQFSDVVRLASGSATVLLRALRRQLRIDMLPAATVELQRTTPTPTARLHWFAGWLVACHSSRRGVSIRYGSETQYCSKPDNSVLDMRWAGLVAPVPSKSRTRTSEPRHCCNKARPLRPRHSRCNHLPCFLVAAGRLCLIAASRLFLIAVGRRFLKTTPNVGCCPLMRCSTITKEGCNT